MPVQVRPAVPEAASGDNRPFWAIFLCKENSPQKGANRGFIAFQASCLLCGLYSPLFPFVFAFSKNASPEQAPLSAPMSATGSISAPSTNEAKVPTTAPIMAGMTIVITIIATIIINAINAFPILIAHLPIEICFTHDQGLLSPSDKSWVKAW